MKKLKRSHCILSLFLVCPFLLSSCFDVVEKLKEYFNPEPYVFSTQYTEEEHIQRLKDRTEEMFWVDQINEVIKGFTVDIVYSIAENTPEYFVLEVEYTEHVPYTFNEHTGNTTPYRHLMGYIYKDDYYVLEDSYIWYGRDGLRVKDCLKVGPSPYSAIGNPDGEKYYGRPRSEDYGVYCVETDGNMVQIATTRCLKHSGCFDIHREELQQYSPKVDCTSPIGGIIPKEEYGAYKDNNRRNCLQYLDGAVSRLPRC